MIKKILQFLKRLFSRTKFLIQQFVTPAVATVEKLKQLMDSPAVDVLTAIIPGNADNLIASRIRVLLPKVLQVLRISDECLKLEHADEIIQCAVNKLKTYDPDAQAAKFHSIAALLAHYLSDKRITWSEAVHLAEMVYKDEV